VSGKRSVGRDNDPPIVGLQTVVGIMDWSKGRYLPKRTAEGPCNWHIRVDLRDVCGVGDLSNDTFNDDNVAV